MSEPRPRSILLVTHFYPPSREAGAARPGAMARHLRELGHRVTVLTSAAYGTLPDDQEQAVVRSWDLQLLAARLRGRERAEETIASDRYARRPHPLSRILIPDAQRLAWMPFARRRAVRIARHGRPDCVITTSPPESTHLVGAALSRRGLPWLADLRDGWVFESIKDEMWPLRLQHRASARLERSLLWRADAVTAVTAPIAEDLRSRLGVEATVVPNGWEPMVREAVAEAGPPLLDPDRVSIVYTGQLAGARRDPEPVVSALARLAARHPEDARKLELVFAGSFTPEEERLFATDISPGLITVLGLLDRDRALALQRAADAALLITGPRRQEASGKLFEYFGARLPILAVAAPDTEAARVIREAGAGTVVAPGELDAIVSALRDAVHRRLPVVSEQARLSYGWPAIAKLMERAVEAAISSRGGP